MKPEIWAPLIISAILCIILFSPSAILAQQTVTVHAVVTARFNGKPRRLIVTANRNGFLYILDRTNGKFLLPSNSPNCRIGLRASTKWSAYLRRLDFAWRDLQIGPNKGWGGVMSTATGLVAYGDDAQNFVILNGYTGKPLWHFNVGQLVRASPMSYAISGKQYLAVAAGSDVFSFALP
jgi:glucose dehydrogenase